MSERDVTVGTEAMSEQARPRSEPRLVDATRCNEGHVRRMPCIDDPWVVKLVWWHAKLTAVAQGEHVRVIEATPHEDPCALDAEGASVVLRGFDGPRVPVTEAGMQEATLSILARRKVQELEAWAQAIVESAEVHDDDA